MQRSLLLHSVWGCGPPAWCSTDTTNNSYSAQGSYNFCTQTQICSQDADGIIICFSLVSWRSLHLSTIRMRPCHTMVCLKLPLPLKDMSQCQDGKTFSSILHSQQNRALSKKVNKRIDEAEHWSRMQQGKCHNNNTKGFGNTVCLVLPFLQDNVEPLICKARGISIYHSY